MKKPFKIGKKWFVDTINGELGPFNTKAEAAEKAKNIKMYGR